MQLRMQIGDSPRFASLSFFAKVNFQRKRGMLNRSQLLMMVKTTPLS
jgi:hypothetical protein